MKSTYAVRDQTKRTVKESTSFKNTFSEIFKLCRSIEKKYNKYNTIDSKDSTELINLNLYEKVWNHPENDPDIHRIWIRDIFIANKKNITKSSNKDAWLRDPTKKNIIIYGGESHDSKPYRIDLCHFYKRACIISARLKREEDEENEIYSFDEIRLPMRNSNIKFRYWLYKCIAFIVTDEKDKKSIKKQLSLIRSSLGIGLSKGEGGGSALQNIMKVAKNVVGQNNLSSISKSVYKNLKDMQVDGTNPDKIGDVIAQTVKSPGFKDMVSTMTNNAKDASIVEEMEVIARDFCPEVSEIIAKEEEFEKAKKDETEKLKEDTNKSDETEKLKEDTNKSDETEKLKEDTNKSDETEKLKEDTNEL
uniref:Uncharacterized protein n=1 Tax=Pithovirus LCPAC401 TaxID=2506595 RepID=A0A481ZC62_9VIRU|nr:MAG: hypothetical protein LCPAC401_03480 [Pithovirus LCPAC401]